MKYVGLILFGLTLNIQYANAANFEIVEHDACSEIRLKTNDDNLRWGLLSAGGGYTVTDHGFKSLSTNTLNQIQFGNNSRISFKLNGKQFVPDAIGENQIFGLELQALFDDNSDAIVGRFIGFTDNDTRNGGWIPDNTAPYGHRSRLLMGALFQTKNLESVSLVVPCSYISGDIDLSAIDNGQCLWVDQHSRTSNGKPYCW
jgi:hypothetical protein